MANPHAERDPQVQRAAEHPGEPAASCRHAERLGEIGTIVRPCARRTREQREAGRERDQARRPGRTQSVLQERLDIGHTRARRGVRGAAVLRCPPLLGHIAQLTDRDLARHAQAERSERSERSAGERMLPGGVLGARCRRPAGHRRERADRERDADRRQRVLGDLCFEIQLMPGIADLVLEQLDARQQRRLGALDAPISFSDGRLGGIVGGHGEILSNSYASSSASSRWVVRNEQGTQLASCVRMNTSNIDHQDEHPGELIAGVLNDARDLAVAEVDKLKAETITRVKGVGEELKIASVGLLILTVAAIMLGTSCSLGLVALGLPGWAGFGIVAVTFTVIGVVFLKRRRVIAEAT
ncbi:MAG: phage holin family protein [Kofleriaceae bacterium]